MFSAHMRRVVMLRERERESGNILSDQPELSLG